MSKQFKILIYIVLIVIVVGGGVSKNLILKIFYPMKYSEYVYKYAEEYDIDPLLIFAIIKAESGFKSEAISTSGAKGLMQLMDTTAEEVAYDFDYVFTSNKLYDAETNIKLGVRYFDKLLAKYDENYYLAIVAYNAGIGNVDRWISEGKIKKDGTDIENVPYKETSNYLRTIMRNYNVYKELYA